MDLRYVLILVINLLKSEHLKWDVFGVVTNPTWFKLTLVFLLSIFISFFSLRFSRTSPQISVRSPHKFSPVMLICFLGALILPQLIFWYFYPIIFFCSTYCATAIFASFVHSLQAFFSRAPDFDIDITAANGVDSEVDLEGQTTTAATLTTLVDSEADLEAQTTSAATLTITHADSSEDHQI